MFEDLRLPLPIQDNAEDLPSYATQSATISHAIAINNVHICFKLDEQKIVWEVEYKTAEVAAEHAIPVYDIKTREYF